MVFAKVKHSNKRLQNEHKNGNELYCELIKWVFKSDLYLLIKFVL